MERSTGKKNNSIAAETCRHPNRSLGKQRTRERDYRKSERWKHRGREIHGGGGREIEGSS